MPNIFSKTGSIPIFAYNLICISFFFLYHLHYINQRKIFQSRSDNVEIFLLVVLNSRASSKYVYIQLFDYTLCVFAQHVKEKKMQESRVEAFMFSCFKCDVPNTPLHAIP